jgi:2-haloacid dehalogenase
MGQPDTAENAQHFSRGDRWATFDCYGTLVDWNAGIRAELARVFGDDRADELLDRYHEVEPEIQREDPAKPYREVLTEAMRRLGAADGDATGLAASLPDWPPFPEARAALFEAHDDGWKLSILSNTDRDLLDATLERLGVPIDHSVVAGEIGSYKPAHRHWERFFEETDADRERYVHVAQSHFHDIVPATELGLRTIWINRLGERGEPPPTRELRDLTRLTETLDELVVR